jgi:hypothetical protein
MLLNPATSLLIFAERKNPSPASGFVNDSVATQLLLRQSIARGATPISSAVARTRSALAVDLQRITWLELSAPHLGEVGRDALRRRFGHRVGIFAVGSPHALSSLSRRF